MRIRKGMRKALVVLLSFVMLVTGMAENAGVATAAGETGQANMAEPAWGVSGSVMKVTASPYGLSNPTKSNGTTTWDCVYFGNYWQNDTDGDGTADTDDEKEPIKWRVLSVDGDDALLLADQSLDCRKYNETSTGVTWETCTLRSWLNGYDADSNKDGTDYSTDNFIDAAFRQTEQSAIRTTSVINDDNPSSGTEGGNDTQDKIYLLSIAEASRASYGFNATFNTGSETRYSKNTEYAKGQGAITDNSDGYAGNGWWWLRSPGDNSSIASNVDLGGWGISNGYDVDIVNFAVRPALHLNLSSDVWRSAGKVTSDGKSTGEDTPEPSEEPEESAAPIFPEESAVPQASAVPATAPPAAGGYGLSNPTKSNGTTTWDCVYFGNYWQNDTDGDGRADTDDEKEPIKWRVLSVDGDDAFLLADKSLDCRKYNETDTGVTWETCTLRSWLNGYGAGSNGDGKNYSTANFIDAAFHQTEQSAIKKASVINDDNPSYGTEGGNDTQDKIYLLSIAEASNAAYGFNATFDTESETRYSKNTEYAKKWAITDNSDGYAGNGWWWLRSPGGHSNDASYVNGHGWGYINGYVVNEHDAVPGNAVRPALHLNLSSDVWRSAGKVTSDGKSTGEDTPEPSERPEESAVPIFPEESAVPQASAAPTTAPPAAGGYGLSNPITNSDGVTTWDCVYFGNYWQNDTDGDGRADRDDEKEPIKWRVLSVDGDDALLLADKSLDCRKYNETSTDVTWETCTLRSWLNGYDADSNKDGTDYSTDNFIDAAFRQTEQSAIRWTSVINDDNPSYGTEGGNDTQDKIYLLSIAEASNAAYGFNATFNTESETRYSKNTEYAKGRGAYTSSYDDDLGYTGNGWWWLRSPGVNSRRASRVWYNGWGYSSGYDVDDDGNAVRPALHLNLSSDVWRSAGKVTSDGKSTGEDTPEPSEEPEESAVPIFPEESAVPQASAAPTTAPPVLPWVSRGPSIPTPSAVVPTFSPVPWGSAANGNNQNSTKPSTDADDDLEDEDALSDLAVEGLDIATGNTVRKGFLTVPRVQLSWDANSKCDGYEIWRREGTGSFKKVDVADDADETEWYDTSVEKGKRYSYKVLGYVEDDDGKTLRAEEADVVSATIRKTVKTCTYTAKRTGRNLKITFKRAEGTKCQIQVRYAGRSKWKSVTCTLNKKIVKKVSPKRLKIRIRTCEKVGGRTAYSKWTKTRTVR